MGLNNVLVVLNYNDKKTTVNFISNTQQCQNIEKIIVVDNCSTDGSYEALQDYVSDRIDVIQTEKNRGYAYGNNYGIRYAIMQYDPVICFVSNPDVAFENNTIIAMQECLEENADIAVVAPVVNQGYNIWHLPQFIGVIESLFLVWHNIHKKKIKKKIIDSKTTIVPVGVVEGSFFAITIQAYKLIDGFDEDTFLYYEENITAQRIHNKNLKISVLRDQRYNHYHSVSIKKQYKSKARAFKLFYPSMKLYLKKYLKVGKIQQGIFEVAYKLAYAEHCLYDVVKKWC